jgi:hypothetical protein
VIDHTDGREVIKVRLVTNLASFHPLTASPAHILFYRDEVILHRGRAGRNVLGSALLSQVYTWIFREY